VRLFKLNWDLRKLLAVLVATFGVMAVVYGDAGLPQSRPDHGKAFEPASESVKPTAPIVGDLLTLCASVGYGLYQVLYKRYVALPQDQEFESGGAYAPLPDSDGTSASEGRKGVDDLAYPPPFGLHSNLLISGMGLMTLFSLWIMLPVVHYSGYERFRLPDNLITVLSIAGIATSGIVFNVGLLVMILLLLLSTRFGSDGPFAPSDFIGHLGTHRCLCRQPPYNRSCSPLRYLGRARYGRHHAMEPGRLWRDCRSIRHLGLRYGTESAKLIIDASTWIGLQTTYLPYATPHTFYTNLYRQTDTRMKE
jgi:hypothetical protein